MTFALVAHCPKTGMFGAAVASSSPAVAARCPFVEFGVGAFSSQNITDPALGARGLSLMRQGASAAEAMAILRRTACYIEYRQLLAVDKNGDTEIFSGAKTLGTYAEAKTAHVACAGNLLADKKVAGAMLDGFLHGEADLGERLLAALAAALQAGGEVGPVHSAGMKIADQTAWPYVDLRCDWSDECPIVALRRIWEIYKPQKDDYIQRALAPALAPGYGVPGEKNDE